jgi:hypothetical protein
MSDSYVANYRCPVCGKPDVNRYLTCDRADCTDGRDQLFDRDAPPRRDRQGQETLAALAAKVDRVRRDHWRACWRWGGAGFVAGCLAYRYFYG